MHGEICDSQEKAIPAIGKTFLDKCQDFLHPSSWAILRVLAVPSKQAHAALRSGNELNDLSTPKLLFVLLRMLLCASVFRRGEVSNLKIQQRLF
jgi:hypothetical protein